MQRVACKNSMQQLHTKPRHYQRSHVEDPYVKRMGLLIMFVHTECGVLRRARRVIFAATRWRILQCHMHTVDAFMTQDNTRNRVVPRGTAAHPV